MPSSARAAQESGVKKYAPRITQRYLVAFQFDPNAGDPEPRKVLGRTQAVWGEQLAELLATDANADQNAAADQPSEHGTSSHNVKPA
jgi:hypothetical protein